MKNHKYISIRTKLNIFILMTVITAIVISFLISYTINAKQIDDYYKLCATDNAIDFASTLDTDEIIKLKNIVLTNEFQKLREQAESDEDENAIKQYLEEKNVFYIYEKYSKNISKRIDNMQSIKYLYALVRLDNNADYDIWLLDDQTVSLCDIGHHEPIEKEFKGKNLTELQEPVISYGGWGWLCTALTPVYDKNNELVCFFGCDVDMEDIMNGRTAFVITSLIGILIFSVILLCTAMVFINKTITHPLKEISIQTKRFDTTDNPPKIINISRASNDEINEIYIAIKDMQINTIENIRNISRLEQNRIFDEYKIEQLKQQTYKDALTAVGNKAAYIKKNKRNNKKNKRSGYKICIDNN